MSYEPDESFALCGECLHITPYREWEGFNWNEDGHLVPSGDDPSVIRCPCCKAEHTDDDSGAGVYEGDMLAMVRERRRLRAEAA